MYLQILIGAAASIVSAGVIALWRMATKFVARSERAIVLVEQQLAPNGGSSLKDQVTTLAKSMQENTTLTRNLKGQIETIDDRVAKVEKTMTWDGNERRRS